jgi:thiosulfate dehydrogenase (quinone) large subunit
MSVQTNNSGIFATHKGLRISLFILRIFLGGLMLEAGLDKLISGNFSAVGYLQHGVGPFAKLFSGLIPDVATLNYLVIWAEIAIGIALILGILIRLASYGGSLLMIAYYLPYLPPSSGWINQQIIYLLIFITLIFSGIGYFLGMDRLFWQFEERKSPWRWLFG